MTFQPVIVGSGLTAWRFLQNTYDRQFDQVSQSATVLRDTEYFQENIAQVQSVDDLVSDRRLLRVSLQAFGLQDDLNSKALISRVLSEGTESNDALANRLADSRYAELSKAFGFGDLGGPWTTTNGFAQDIVGKYRSQGFELAIGSQDDSMRLALNAQRKLPELAESSGSNNAKWFQIMGTPPLRSVFETALGLPSSFGQLDIDKQLEVFKEKAGQRFGTDQISEFSDDAKAEKLIETYLLQTQTAQSQTGNGANIALLLLQNI